MSELKNIRKTINEMAEDLKKANPYLLQTGTPLQYPYYDKHSEIIFDYFNPKWDDSFDMFFMMAMMINPDDAKKNSDGGVVTKHRTYSFLLECQNLQQKAKKNALTEEEVNHFKDSLDHFFTYTDEGPPRKYLQPSKISDNNGYETKLWEFAKAAVALYKHCQEIIAKGK